MAQHPPSPDNDQLNRIRQARQVLAGPDVNPPDDPLRFDPGDELISPTQRTYLLAVAALLLISLLVLVVASLGAASVPLFLLALALLLGWVVF